MALIDLIEVSKKFGEKVIFDGANFSINEGERVAIIGKNGEGKSTLMKIICGEYELDDGRIITQNGIKIQMLSQTPKFNETLNVKEALKAELSEIYEALDEHEQILEMIAKEPQNQILIKREDELAKFIAAKDGYEIDSKIERIIEHFSLKEYENRAICTLSGGEIRRVGLGALILKKPDVLLLDEPTNHLDVYMVKFLEDMLLAGSQTIIFVSHDRYFIEKIATRTCEIDNGKIVSFAGGYENYLIKKQEILASLAKSHETLLKQLKSEEEWLKRGVKARLKRNEGRKERVFAMREAAKKNPSQIRKIKLELERANLNFNRDGRDGLNRKKMLFECKNLAKSLGGKRLFSDFNTRILQGEKIAIVGPNGSGKSTLLKIFLGEISPDCGQIKKGDIKIGYFDQKRENIDDEKSLIENFCPNGGDHIFVRGHFMHVFGYLKNFLFPKEFLDRPVSTLSGGEKNRLALAKLFTEQYDCLILDEPTNDLDIATINILESYLLSFEGALIIVSHDRYFTDKIANKLFAFENGKINEDYHDYSEYLEICDKFNEIEKYEKQAQNLDEISSAKSSQTQKTQTKLTYKQTQIYEKHPILIANLEEKIANLGVILSDPARYNEYGLQKAYDEQEKLKIELSRLENEYFEVLEVAENLGI